MNTRPVVAHVHFNYLSISETFIHRYIAGLRGSCPVVMTEQIQNESSYQFSRYYRVHAIKGTDSWLYRVFAKIIRLTVPTLSCYWHRHAAYSHLLSRNRVKLIHAHYGDAGWFCLPLKRLHRLPLVVSFHGVDASVLPQLPGWLPRLQDLFNTADCITTPSEFMTKHLENLGCSPSKLVVLHYGLDLNEWPYEKDNCNGDPSRHNLLMVARLVEKKGIPYAIRAVSRLIEQFPSVRLRIVGEGPLRDELETLITQLDMSTHVELLGARPNADVIDLMKQSDVLVAPSVTAANGDQEGLPNVLMEAAATGLPAVATVHTGIPEIVKDGVSGFLVPERDAEALADRLVRLLADRELQTRMGQAARRIVEQEFNIVKSVDRLEQIYTNLLR